MYDKLEQAESAESPMVVTLSGIVILCKQQLSNANLLNLVTLFGIAILDKP